MPWSGDNSQQLAFNQPRGERSAFSFISTDAPADRNVPAADFNTTFGADVGGELRRVGCERVRMEGDRVTLSLARTHIEPIGQGGIQNVRLGPSVSFDMTRNGNEIRIQGVRNVDLDFGRFTPYVGVPDVTLTRGNVRALGINVPVPNEVYDNVGALLTSLGR